MLRAGIVGLPNVGKSTLFNALTSQQSALAANYPFATIEPNIGVVPVPDERLEPLAKIVKTKTMASRLNRAIEAVGVWCRTNRHVAIRDQHRILSLKLRGHCEYYGITGNSQALRQFRTAMAALWRKWLNRRSNRGRRNWEWWNALETRYRLPPAYAVHSKMRRT